MLSDFKKNLKRRNYVILILSGIIIFSVLILLVFADIKIYQKRNKLSAQIDSLKNQVQEIQKKNDELKQGIANSDNTAYIEKVAREELDLQKPGEKVVSFVMPQTTLPQNNSAPKNIFQNWLAWLSNIFKK